MRVSAILLAALACGTAAAQSPWQPLFDGKSLAGWKEAAFTGRGKVRVEDGVILLGGGAPMTGVTTTRTDLPHTNYEVRFEAARVEGADFFASLTFPVGDSHCTWVTGGWGGDIVGLSNIDGWDASDNETRTYYDFDPGRWYNFRVRVTSERIQCWIDEQPVINVAIAGRAVSLRFGDMKLNAPLGFASYATTGGIRKVEFRTIRGQ